MRIEKLDRVAVSVFNLDEAEKFFSDLLGIKFYRFQDKLAAGEITREKTITKHADPAFEEAKTKVAISPTGLELIETAPPTKKEEVRSFHFKVDDLDEAVADMELRGVRLLAEVKLGKLREAIYSAQDLHGARIVLAEYEAPTAIEAILSK